MKYKGIELKEFTSEKPVIFDPPKRMLAWDYDDETPTEVEVIAFIPNRYHKAIEQMSVYIHCAEIPDSELATFIQLAAWASNGFGIMKREEAVNCPEHDNMPFDHWLAKRLGMTLFKSGLGGIDIMILVAMNNNCVSHVTVAIPMLPSCDNTGEILDIVKKITGCTDVILNGTGNYVSHSSIADCGITGRKLAVDFYGGNCRIGGARPGPRMEPRPTSR